MRHDKLEKELQLLLLLTENRQYTVPQLCKKMEQSRRNIYYYLEFFRDAGFKVEKYGNCFSIDRSSPFFGRLIEKISFTEEEAIVISRLLNRVTEKNAIVETLKKKMERFYDLGILAKDTLSEKDSHIITVLHDAIKHENQVVLKGYSSPHSKTRRDRLVEPFMLMDGNREVRCFEPASGLNKTFKIIRMDGVETLADNWAFKEQHKKMFTDAFLFSGEKKEKVELILGQLSHDLLIEEYPRTEPCMTKEDDGRWRMRLDVCSYIGIGRFVLGLLDDIEIVGTTEFKDYLTKKLETFSGRLRPATTTATK